ncbi:hypothetical protein RJ55_06399 [Drechmeria coniospora]|nr:hypothetical protein RJ55_06399 [Drechmeria coniospora]
MSHVSPRCRNGVLDPPQNSKRMLQPQRGTRPKDVGLDRLSANPLRPSTRFSTRGRSSLRLGWTARGHPGTLQGPRPSTRLPRRRRKPHLVYGTVGAVDLDCRLQTPLWPCLLSTASPFLVNVDQWPPASMATSAAAAAAAGRRMKIVELYGSHLAMAILPPWLSGSVPPERLLNVP